MIVVFAVGFRGWELWRMINKEGSEEAQKLIEAEKELAFEVIEARNKTLASQSRHKFQELRGDFVVGLIVLVFTLEVMFLNPENLGGILPFQILYLLGVVIYQFTFYREAHEPFVWGLVHGRRYVEDIRWLLLNAQAVAVTGLLLRVAVNAMSAQHISDRWLLCVRFIGWLAITAAMEIEILSAISICSSKDRLIEIDKDDFFNPDKWESESNVKNEILGSFRKLRALKGAWVGYFMPCSSRDPLWFRECRAFWLILTFIAATWFWMSHVFSHLPNWTNILLVGTPLPLSLLVLANVGILPALFSWRAQRLGYKAVPHDGDSQRKEVAAQEIQRKKWERYARRAVMASVLYVTSVLSFGYVIYPHIPVQKAGGNYETANHVCVVLVKEAPLRECPNTLLPSLAPNEAFVALEEDSDWVYLANDQDTHDIRGNYIHDILGGPHCWSWAGIENVYCRPRVYAVSRMCIAGIVDAPREDQSQPRCPAGDSESATTGTDLKGTDADSAFASGMARSGLPLAAQKSGRARSKPPAGVSQGKANTSPAQ
jgi:hypothetical protein